MKIVFSTSYYKPYISGLTNSVSEIARGLTDLGHSCKVLTNKHQPILADEEPIDGVHVRRFDYQLKISKALISGKWLLGPIGDLKEADRVVVNLPQPEGFWVAILSRIMNKKVISLYACDISMGDHFLGKLGEIVIDISSWLCLALSQKVITYTEDYANKSRVLKYFIHKTRPVYPPIPDADKIPVIRPSDRRLVIGMVARVSKEKGFEEMLRALTIIESKIKKKVFLRVAGPLNATGEEKYAGKIVNIVKNDKLRVFFTGTLIQSDMDKFYDSIDILAVPSTNSTEAFGLVQAEAMKRAVPVVASDLPGVRIPIKATKMGLLCKPRDAEDLAAKIMSIAGKRKAFAEKYLLARKIFDYKATIGIYEKTICN